MKEMDSKPEISENSRRVLEKRYLKKDVNGKIIETPEEMFMRVAGNIAKADANYNRKADLKKTEDDFYSVMSTFEFLPNSPTLMNAGRDLQQLSACFTKKQKILLNPGYKNIDQIKTGDKVVTAKGRVKKALEVHQRKYKGPLYTVNIQGLMKPTLNVTEEHPIFAVKKEEVICKRIRSNNCNGVIKKYCLRMPQEYKKNCEFIGQIFKPRWTPIKDLEKGDFVLVNTNKETKDIKEIKIEDYLADESYLKKGEYLVAKGRPNEGKRIPNKIKIDSNFLKLAGYWLADGSLSKRCDKYGIIRFTFDLKEKAYCKEVQKIMKEKFNLTAKEEYTKKQKTIQLRFDSTIVAELFYKLFGNGFNGKRLPEWIITLPQEKQFNLVIGLFRGEGLNSKGERQDTIFISLSNEKLANDIWNILLRLGYNFNINPRIPKGGTKKAFRISAAPSECSDLVEAVRKGEYRKRKVFPQYINTGGMALRPIDKIEKRLYDGEVYNLEVEKDHSYLANGVAVHNCFVLPIRDSMEGIFDSLKSSALIHKCLVPETLVSTENGIKRLKELKIGDRILTDEGYFSIEGLYENKGQIVYEVLTDRGFSLKGTSEHKLLVVHDNGDFIWREIGELKRGDWIITKPAAGLRGGNNALPIYIHKSRPPLNSGCFKAREIKFPKIFTSELAELIGIYIGDGSNHRDGIRFSVGEDDTEMVRIIQRLSKTIFDKDASLSHKSDKGYEVSILSILVKKWFDFLGITKPSSKKARIPEIIFKASEDIICAFLRGLFSTDGCIRKSGHITLTTPSKILSEELQSLMFYVGIPTHRRHDRVTDSYQVSICTKDSFVNFKKKVGFLLARKNKRLTAVGPKDIFKRGEVIPNQRISLKEWYADIDNIEEKREARLFFGDIINRVSEEREVSRQRVMSVAEKSKMCPQFLKALLDKNYFFTKVSEVNPVGVMDTYDITVSDRHTYLANGFITHNSGGGTGFSFSNLRPKSSMVKSTGGVASGPVSFMKVFDSATQAVKQGGTRRGANMGILRVDHPDILEFITCKENNKDITNFNISVAVNEDFMERAKNNQEYNLIDPHTKKITGTLNAKEVFEKIIKMAWKNGEPGIIFIDRMNKYNPTPSQGEYEATNPCVTGDTFVSTEHGLMKIKDMAEQYNTGGISIFTDNRVLDILYASQEEGGIATQTKLGLSLNPISKAFKTGIKFVLKLVTNSGLELKATPDHKIMTTEGWIEMKDLKLGEHEILVQPAESEFSKAPFVEKIKSIEPYGEEEVYDLTEPCTHSFIANGIVISNCGEQVLLPYESCNLGSINLSKMVSGGEIDWKRLAETTKITVHFLDNVIDMNKFPLAIIREKTRENRKIGLGVMGFADMLIKLGIPYDSEEALKKAEEVMKFILENARVASEELAEKRGPFPNYEKSIYAGKKKRPLRNATLTTIAPTGTLSIIANCSSGIEPIFAVSYIRNVMDNDELVEAHPLFLEIARERGFYSEELMKKIANEGGVQNFEEIPDDVKRLFRTSLDISPEYHIKMQSAFQCYTNNAVSKTINFPNKATVDDVRKAYMLAYESGCKGITIYRDKSREEQVLNIGKVNRGNPTGNPADNPTENPAVQEKPEAADLKPRPRSTVIHGTTTKVSTGCGNLYVTINNDEMGQPFEVFMQMGKAGGCAMSQLEAIGRLVSLALRSGVNVDSIVSQLRGIRCPSPSWEKGGGRIFSCSDAIARVIERRIAEKEEAGEKNLNAGIGYLDSQLESKDTSASAESATDTDTKTATTTKTKSGSVVGVCPDCGAALRHIEGCQVCNACGYSKC